MEASRATRLAAEKMELIFGVAVVTAGTTGDIVMQHFFSSSLMVGLNKLDRWPISSYFKSFQTHRLGIKEQVASDKSSLLLKVKE